MREIKTAGATFRMSDKTYADVTEGARLAEIAAAKMAYRLVRDRYLRMSKLADEAFVRWFTKRNAGIRTNGAAATKLANEANYLSADVAVAESKLYALDIVPETVDAEDGVERWNGVLA